MSCPPGALGTWVHLWPWMLILSCRSQSLPIGGDLLGGCHTPHSGQTPGQVQGWAKGIAQAFCMPCAFPDSP